MSRKIAMAVSAAALLVFLFSLLYPVFLLLSKSLYNGKTFEPYGYIRFLLLGDRFYMGLVNSFLYASIISLGQLVPTVLMSFVLAKFDFKPKKALYLLYIMVFLVPFQVLMLPSHHILDFLGLMGTKGAVCLSQIYLPFGVVFFTQYIKGIPDGIVESAQIDGASASKILTKVILPMSKNILAAIFAIMFVDNWNIMEPVIMFAGESSNYPATVVVREAIEQNSDYIFIAGALCMLLPLTIYLAVKNFIRGNIPWENHEPKE